MSYKIYKKENHQGMLGKKHSINSRLKMRQAKKGKPSAKRGIKLSEEHKEKLRQAKLKNPTKYWLGKKRPKTEEWAKKISVANKGKKRTIDDRKKMSIKHIKGANHHWWRGGVTTEYEKQRKNLEYKLWREAVLKRDDYTCQVCGIKKLDNETHHIKPFSDFPKFRTTIENGITICKSCHKKTHKKG